MRGVYVIPSYENSLRKFFTFFQTFLYKTSFNSLLDWFGVIFVREGVYNEGIFRFSITLPDNFPSDTKAPVSMQIFGIEVKNGGIFKMFLIPSR